MTLSPELGYCLLIGLGACLLAIALVVKKLVHGTGDFIVAGRRVGFGFGVGSIIAVWTWSMAVMMSSAQAFSFGTSGLLWFVVPNGLAVMLMIPFAVLLRRRMPEGYTIVEFIRKRFDNPMVASLMLVVMVAMIICEILINLFGIVLVMDVVFGLPATAVLIVALIVVTVYSYFGGIWTSAITGALCTLGTTVPAALVVLYVLGKAGGADAVFSRVGAADPENLQPFAPAAAVSFGITLALGLLASTMADQTFWQKAWSMKPKTMARTFLWAGLWFYPIPLTLGLLGLVGISMGVSDDDLGANGAGAIGPYVVTHMGLPVIIIVLYVMIILQACYSTVDGAFSALSSLVATDIVRRRWPSMSDRNLLKITKASIVAGGIIGGVVVLASSDYITTVNTIYFFKAALIVPLGAAIFWRRMNAWAFILGVLVSAAVGFYVRETVNELAGTATLIGLSILIVVAVSLMTKTNYDFSRLDKGGDQLADGDESEDLIASNSAEAQS
ncbi:sodium:solute symporter family protein [Gordonia westfalica]|uniref:Na+/proline symporter n=1 Tax=Gordonia westfalica TaxID=158898 RepID=A0A1H2IPQ9_9ACTN|nr:sodium:solute symporter [Gordonia westfalica]SDU46170.1 Na+/proline symporter [Gordonia westfalica]